MPREFALPDLGEGISEAQIIRVLVKAGEQVQEDQYLMEVETDKAAVEIPSPFAGIAQTVHVQEGQTVKVGDVIVTFDDGKAGAAPAAVAAVAEERPKVAESAAPTKGSTTVAAAPAVRKLAREMGVDLQSVTGTGPKGRITKADIEGHISATGQAVTTDTAAPGPGEEHPIPPPRPKPPMAGVPEGIADTDKWGPIRRVPLNQIRKTIAAQMSRSAFTIPHVTHCDEADITELDRMRRRLNEATGGDPKLTAMSFLIRAVCVALRKYPIFNASFDEESGQIICKEYVNMGIAVDTQRGLIVPVIRHADQLTMRGIAGALRTIADKVRSNQFVIEDLRGGTFTITNVGALGGTFTTPLINYPEVAILGLGRSRKSPVIRDGEIVPALILPISVSFDHRATDGASAARFTREVISYLEMPARLLLD